MIPPFLCLVGNAICFGLWQDSLAAGLFMFLFLDLAYSYWDDDEDEEAL